MRWLHWSVKLSIRVWFMNSLIFLAFRSFLSGG
jgi:hypothetical protein